ncbi:MAG: ankyrin repeat domain-containing protein [Campylobacterales bacterium]|nr:ankyrin repeat domain-containing protein [Campylobacterales bacterium]
MENSQETKKVLEAIENDALIVLEKYLKEGYDLSKPVIIGEEYELDEPDETPILFYAIRKYASVDLIKVLMRYGVDIHELNEDGLSALDVAIKFKRNDVVDFVIGEGISVNETQRRSGINPLMLACCFSDIAIIDTLLKHGADINKTDKSGMSAKDYAKRLGQKKVVEFLSQKGGKHNLYPEGERV